MSLEGLTWQAVLQQTLSLKTDYSIGMPCHSRPLAPIADSQVHASIRPCHNSRRWQAKRQTRRPQRRDLATSLDINRWIAAFSRFKYGYHVNRTHAYISSPVLYRHTESEVPRNHRKLSLRFISLACRDGRSVQDRWPRVLVPTSLDGKAQRGQGLDTTYTFATYLAIKLGGDSAYGHVNRLGIALAISIRGSESTDESLAQ
jgi:hypothetical protein